MLRMSFNCLVITKRYDDPLTYVDRRRDPFSWSFARELQEDRELQLNGGIPLAR